MHIVRAACATNDVERNDRLTTARLDVAEQGA